jgi:uncharacterized repeat protein (TIGR01451 family)
MTYSIAKLYFKANKPAKSLVAGAAVLVLLGSLFGQNAFAADPRFNFESTDLETLSVANINQSTGWQSSSVSANSNDQVAFQVYYRNGVPDSIAYNTRVRLTFPTSAQNSITVSVALSADNAPTVYDSVTINSATAQRLTFNTSDIRWYPDRTTVPTYISPSSSGTGYIEVNLGNIGPCWEHQGYVNFYASLTPETTTGNLTIQKTVRNITTGQTSYSESANAQNNERVAFQIQLQNTGGSALNNVVVRDTLPSYLSYVSGTARLDGSTLSDSVATGETNIGSMAAGQTRNITLEATVNSSANQTVTNYAYVRADGVSERNDSADVYIGSSTTGGTLTITKTVSNQNTSQNYYTEEVNAVNNDRVKFRIQIQNTGNTTVNNVFVYDTLPSNLTYVSGSTRQDDSYMSDGIVSGGISLGSLYAGAYRQITFEATVNISSYYYYGSSYNQTLTNYAYVRADGVSERNDTARIYVGGQNQQYGTLNITKTGRNISTGQSSYASSVNAKPGERIGFMIQISTYNNNLQINNVRVWDSLPSGMTYVSGSAKMDGNYVADSLTSGGVNLGTLLGTQTRILTFEATVNSGLSNQTLTNYAYVYGDNVGQQSATCQIYVGASAVTTGFQKRVSNQTWSNGTDTDNQARVGDTLQYSLNYTNNTGSTLYNVQIMDTLPSYTSYISASQNGYYDQNSNQITWNLGTLNSGSSVSVSYQAKVENASYNFVIANTAMLRANNLNSMDSNETRTTVITPQVKGAAVQAVTGGNSLAGKTAAAVLAACWMMFFAYLAMEYLPDWRTWRFRLAAWKIRVKGN